MDSPRTGTTIEQPAVVRFRASAEDSDGSVAKVVFFADNLKVGEDSIPPYELDLETRRFGTILFRAEAQDNRGGIGKSLESSVEIVPPNEPPKVTILSPLSGSSYITPFSLDFSVNAIDSDGQVRLVEFFKGTEKIGQSTTPPFTINLPDLAVGQHVFSARATDDDGDVRTTFPSLISVVDASSAPLTRVVQLSPDDGERAVAVTRESIVRFSQPLAVGVNPDEDDVYATYAGEKLAARLQVSNDRRSITLFYQQPLPGSARIQVTLRGDELLDFLGQPIDVDEDGLAGGSKTYSFTTLGLTSLAGTTVCGRVFASELGSSVSKEAAINLPLKGVKITVDGRENELFAITDEFGNFRLENTPSGRFFVHIDGRPIAVPELGIRFPDLAYYPFVGKAWESIPGREVNIGEVYLPLVNQGTLQVVSDTEDTFIGFPASVLDQNPQLDGVSISVPAGSLLSDSGTTGGSVGIAPVPPDRLPGTLPPGLESSVVITVQTDGSSNFDRPVPVCFPNLPNPVSGELLPPGGKSGLWSFNHDTGRFELVGPMTVSADGRFVCSDPGVGIIAPGWHCSGPGTSCGDAGGGSDCPPPCKDGGPDPCPPDMCCSEEEEGGAGDPVYLSTGEFVHEEVDLHIKGRGMDFELKRRYSSREGGPSPIGNNWDLNYNLSIEASGRIFRLNHGKANTRFLYKNADGRFERRAHFLEMEQQEEDESFILTFDNQSRIQFHPCDGSAMDGRATEILDRNGNRLQLIYDDAGRLKTVLDTLNRPIHFQYNSDGFIESVTDFTGRTVRYAYYQDGEEGGSHGDLKSVTSPSVVGTPHGNDFPEGKTRTYTYTQGFQDQRLNHNLLTITDGRRNDPNDSTVGEEPYLVNEYASTMDPTDISFDRVVRQYWGGDILDFNYTELSPVDPGTGEITKTILNDRNGNVSEHYFDFGNRRVRERLFTGRADPRSPTTEFDNRPVQPFRLDDPPFFETRWTFNFDSLMTKEARPNGNVTENIYEVDLDPNAAPRTRGNLRMIRRLPGGHEPAGDQDQIVERFEYDTNFGCNACGFNFVTRHEDARGNVTLSEYDGFGNRIKRVGRIDSIIEEWEYNEYGQTISHTHPDNGSNHRRMDRYEYHENGPERGYPARHIIDTGGFELTTQYTVDALGRVIVKTDPRGNDSFYEYNALDQIIGEHSRAVDTPSGAVRYATLTWFDANNNKTRIDVQNVNDQGLLVEENPWFTTRYEYEILNHVARIQREVDVDKVTTTEYGYDAKRNLVLTRFGEAVNGQQPENTINKVFDERNLLFSETRAEGHPDQSTTVYDYDKNGNLIRRHEGMEDSPHTYVSIYDGYDRQVREIDPMGNEKHFEYDPNNNLMRYLVLGEKEDVEGNENNVRLEEIKYDYDAMDRRTHERVAFFDTETQEDLLDGEALTMTVYSNLSQVIQTVNDNGHATHFIYDTANRLDLTLDAKGNTERFVYDANSNRIEKTEIDKSDLGFPDEVFTTRFEFDALDRLAAAVDNIGNRHEKFYDSRSNPTLSVDANGNRVRDIFDGLNRKTSTIYFLTEDGTGGTEVVDTIVTRQTWDDSSRLTGQIDDNGNLTAYEYDPLNRQIATVYADLTRDVALYNVHGVKVSTTDPNGSVIRASFDLLDRVVRNDMEVGEGVSDDTTFETFAYDGKSRLVKGVDDDSVVERSYNSQSQVISEILMGRTIRCVFDGVGNQTKCIYPSGRVVVKEYDELEREKRILGPEGIEAVNYYVGRDRLQRRDFSNGTRMDVKYDGVSGIENVDGDFGVKRKSQIKHTRVTDGTVIDGYDYKWDSMGNKIEQSALLSDRDETSREMEYDSIYRMSSSMRIGSRDNLETIYTFDGLGNRIEVNGNVEGGKYFMEATIPEPADFQMNQYTVTPRYEHLEYDLNGNLLALNGPENHRVLTFDGRNRLSIVEDQISGVLGEYFYDVLGRRIGKRSMQGELGYALCGDRIVEEFAQNELYVSYVFGTYIDELIALLSGEKEPFFYQLDDQYTVISLSRKDENIERYLSYLDDGNPERVGSELDKNEFAKYNTYMYTGRRYDIETGFYYFRKRYYHPNLLKYLSLDSIGIWGDSTHLGNGYAFMGNNPHSNLDPFGQAVNMCELSCGLATWAVGTAGAAGCGWAAAAGGVTAGWAATAMHACGAGAQIISTYFCDWICDGPCYFNDIWTERHEWECKNNCTYSGNGYTKLFWKRKCQNGILGDPEVCRWESIDCEGNGTSHSVSNCRR